MNTFEKRVEKIKAYWSETFGRGPAFDTCVVVSVMVLALLYFAGLFWMIPFSVAKAFTK